MPNPAIVEYGQWRSPQPQKSSLTNSPSIPGLLSPKTDSPAPDRGIQDHAHPSFLPPCEHGDDGDMHAHAFDLLSLSGGTPSQSHPPLPHTHSTPQHIPSSVPNRSYLSSTRPPVPVEKTANKENAPKARRMSSSTTGVLGRGKLGLTGTVPVEGLGLGGVGKDVRTTSVPAPGSMTRRSTLGSSPAPQLFDFAKTDRRPSLPRPNSGLLPNRPTSNAPMPKTQQTRQRVPSPKDDIELDMQFDGDEDDDADQEGSGRSGSADIEMDEDDEYPVDNDGTLRPEWEKLALGTGSGGVKGRRKGMVFKCETCSKEYKHPSCLVKHRWEHSPHWKEPTALSMSKHQQVQMLEAAAILAHLDPTLSQGRSLPSDKSLWPAILSPSQLQDSLPRRASRVAREASLGRSPSTSTAAPLTPSSLRESTALGTLVERKDERKFSPESDSTTSSMGAAEPYIPRPLGVHPSPRTVPTGLGIRSPPTSSPYARPARPLGIAESRAASSIASSIPEPATPHSVGSMPDMTNLQFSSSLSSSLTIPAGAAMSPRGIPLYMKTGMVGGGMFGVQTRVQSSSIRSGAAEEDEEKEEDETWGRREEKEENGEWMTGDMEL